ncbi:MAG TPA: hypothetical protein VGE52_12690, partial [Pirellulales bacterium]
MKKLLSRCGIGLLVSASMVAPTAWGQAGASRAGAPAQRTAQAQKPAAPAANAPAGAPAGQAAPPPGARATNQAAGPATPGISSLKEVARINNLALKREELERECVERHGDEVLENLINKQLITYACNQQKILVTDEETAEEIDRVAKRFGLPRDQWVQMLKDERNVSPDQYKRDIIWPALALRKLAGNSVQVSREEVQLAMEQEYGPSVQVRMILLEDEKTANEVHAKAVADPNQFPRLAVDYSKDYNTASTGGLMQPV